MIFTYERLYADWIECFGEEPKQDIDQILKALDGVTREQLIDILDKFKSSRKTIIF